MHQARVKPEARWHHVVAGGGQHFHKSAFTPVNPGSEAEVAMNPDLELVEVAQTEVEPVAEPDDPLAARSGDGVPAAIPSYEPIDIGSSAPAAEGDAATDLTALTKEGLMTYAAERGFLLKASLTKAEMVAAIQEA